MPSKEVVTFWLDMSAPMGLLSRRAESKQRCSMSVAWPSRSTDPVLPPVDTPDLDGLLDSLQIQLFRLGQSKTDGIQGSNDVG